MSVSLLPQCYVGTDDVIYYSEEQAVLCGGPGESGVCIDPQQTELCSEISPTWSPTSEPTQSPTACMDWQSTYNSEDGMDEYRVHTLFSICGQTITGTVDEDANTTFTFVNERLQVIAILTCRRTLFGWCTRISLDPL